ncbi:uncharacterized protein LOC129598379 [Paramacrobiotus metropolitanus]|uniref:uncharacterized protein LOC129598379 n=1 Tax=Paramacrobiotus metropolitanus TaxID=2943436 RepID=UPI0024456E97|nr:uncharacterized protein LOC129598379 [Paramacrobiotus metropolitanus]
MDSFKGTFSFKGSFGRIISDEYAEKLRLENPERYEMLVNYAEDEIRADQTEFYYVRRGIWPGPDTLVVRAAADRIRKDLGLPPMPPKPESPRTRRRRRIEENNRILEEERCCVECNNNGPGSCGRILWTIDDEPVPKLWGSGNLDDWKGPDPDFADWWNEKAHMLDPTKILPVEMLWVNVKPPIPESPKKKKRKHIVVQRHSLRGIPYNYWK